MCTLLYIKANPKSNEESRTFRISEQFIDAYKQSHPEDNIITIDLYKDDVYFLSEEAVKMHVTSPGEGKEHPILKYAYQFLEADKYVFAEPLWNLSIPSILKAYIDYITFSDITFKYTAEGPVGLCQGKKAMNITTRGGGYSEGAFASYEMGDRYLRTILGFLGVADFTTIVAENLDMIGTDIESVVGAAIQEAQNVAKSF
ncbi:MAG TPA: FMN-dependent NADH-azoreductase [Clostridiales bacterium]|nr:MAG: FMN-dependent NADH-azoreductase [Clostridiales bacterium GWD2_32_19]HCC07417.1 FMN-dependent NADH-azoreductase [Clostridiales bacterium]